MVSTNSEFSLTIGSLFLLALLVWSSRPRLSEDFLGHLASLSRRDSSNSTTICPKFPPPVPAPQDDGACKSLQKSLDGWFSHSGPMPALPNADQILDNVTYEPSTCVLRDYTFRNDTSRVCAAFAASNITYLLLTGDSLPGNLFATMQRFFFNVPDVTNQHCWSERHGSFTSKSARGTCQEGIHCDGKLRIAFFFFQKLDEKVRLLLMRFLISDAYGSAAAEARAAGRSVLPDAILMWYGLHNLRTAEAAKSTSNFFQLQADVLDGIQRLRLGAVTVQELDAMAAIDDFESSDMTYILGYLRNSPDLSVAARLSAQVAANASSQTRFLDAFRRIVYLGITFPWMEKKPAGCDTSYNSFQNPHVTYEYSNSVFRAMASRGAPFVDMFPFSGRATHAFSTDSVHYDATWEIVLGNAVVQWLAEDHTDWPAGAPIIQRLVPLLGTNGEGLPRQLVNNETGNK
jgi:hypothetical protein